MRIESLIGKTCVTWSIDGDEKIHGQLGAHIFGARPRDRRAKRLSTLRNSVTRLALLGGEGRARGCWPNAGQELDRTTSCRHTGPRMRR